MSRFRNILKVVSNVLFGVSIGLLILVTALVLLNNIGGDGRNRIGNFGFARVATGSMEPDIPTGCFILIENVDPSVVEIGDTITFWSHDPTVPQGVPVSHRVIRIEQENGQRHFITKGIANPAEDPYPVYDTDLVGKVVWTSVVLGAIIGFAQSPITFPILIGVLVICFVINTVTVIQEAKKYTDATNEAAVAAAREEAMRELQQTDHTVHPQEDSES